MLVPLRHVVLAALAASVLVLGVYLFIQVRSTPARAEGQTVMADTHSGTPPHPSSASSGSSKPVSVHNTEPPPQVPPPQVPPSTGDDDDLLLQQANPKLEAVMDQANKAYDRQDFEEAKVIAAKVLAKQPTNIRMMRIMVSASCIDGDTPQAQKYYEQLPKADREQMKARCDKYGFSFKEPPQ